MPGQGTQRQWASVRTHRPCPGVLRTVDVDGGRIPSPGGITFTETRAGRRGRPLLTRR
jgi:hypothetical protein